MHEDISLAGNHTDVLPVDSMCLKWMRQKSSASCHVEEKNVESHLGKQNKDISLGKNRWSKCRWKKKHEDISPLNRKDAIEKQVIDRMPAEE